MEKKFDTPWREGGQYMTDMAKEGRLIDAVKLAVRGGCCFINTKFRHIAAIPPAITTRTDASCQTFIMIAKRK